ncbi:MAG: OmpA family protein [Gammaproteobacteria bacterium]|nr:OmpA family protein [Gammaproteobacteria bacterium]MBQ0773118.1 OmpA family protein [Gammaproteobacteria bacterium]
MKRSTLSRSALNSAIALTVLTSTFSATASAAEEMPERFFYFGAHASQYFSDINSASDNDKPDDTTLPGIQAGYRFNPSWSLQLWWERNSFSSTTDNFEGDLSNIIASARYHFSDTSLLGFEPYMGAAIADYVIDVDKERNDTLIGAEFGLQQRLRPHWLIDFGARPLYSLDSERWDAEAYVALNFLFGGDTNKSNGTETTSEATAQKTAVQDVTTATVFGDKDGDGISDGIDQCPETAAGASVDTNGCEIDSDNDGVSDSLDQCPGSAARVKVDAQGCKEMLQNTVRETLYIEFAHNTANVADDSVKQIETLSEKLYQYPDAQLTLEGYTDSSGSAAYNKRLSQQRADGVKQVLIDRFGIDAARITAVGKGEESPIADNSTADGQRKNRRVEVLLSNSN